MTVTGLGELDVTLSRAASRALPETEAVVTRTAELVTQGWRARWAGIGHAPALPAAVGFDLYHLPGSVRARIGPDKNARQGALGNIFEYGTVNNPPIPGGAPSLDEQAPAFASALDALAARLVEGDA
ncbi:hypothetical protein Lfu02_79840 [Longispora fulva]|nr:hypothetical protein Lfu02_79840 [Longispora fulva]